MLDLRESSAIGVVLGPTDAAAPIGAKRAHGTRVVFRDDDTVARVKDYVTSTRTDALRPRRARTRRRRQIDVLDDRVEP
ncbi:MAG: hypothetical protein QOJ85_2292, partial [Solirubrobacteraceae bacterium]|nr:hypothetical protein [Solirubrobacteraceae bacterium]